ncbi:8145_t:CDS:2 [Funneliformis caledonium]|uniref:8145_t:CDS:1 n=1 Tax=Funneliformis caledonium TaxID=1117310 RepID=A0A9N8ZIU8_9GLOM|nr:8145_t:CDS:2 [Funneliformis caledonium]
MNNVSKFAFAFPPECIRLITLNLKDDKKSLHSCLLTSRDWCRETVDLLWSRPFYFIYACKETSFLPTKSSEIINTSCHCSTKKRQIQDAKLLRIYLQCLIFKYNEELLKREVIQMRVRITMFNYVKFLKVLDLNELYIAVKDWEKSLDTEMLKSISLDTQFILHLSHDKNYCLSLIKDIKQPDASYLNTYQHLVYLNNLIDIDLPKSPKLNQNLVNLSEIELYSYSYLRLTHFLCSISKICKNIRKLVFRANMVLTSTSDKFAAIREANQVATLIKFQHHLVHLELFDINDEEFWEVVMDSVIKSQSNSLNVLIFNNVTICSINVLFHLVPLQNLKELRFDKCIFKTSSAIQPKENEHHNWKDLWFPKLKYLEIDFTDDTKDDSKELTSILLKSLRI